MKYTCCGLKSIQLCQEGRQGCSEIFQLVPIVITWFTSELALTLLNLNSEPENEHQMWRQGEDILFFLNHQGKFNPHFNCQLFQICSRCRVGGCTCYPGTIYIHDLWSDEPHGFCFLYLMCPMLHSLGIRSLRKL